MDITNLVLSISLGTVLAIASLILGILTYRLNKKKKEAEDARANAAKAKEEKEQAVNDAIALQDLHTEILLMGKDVGSIKGTVDKMSSKQDQMADEQKDFDKRLAVLEKRYTPTRRRAAVVNGNK